MTTPQKPQHSPIPWKVRIPSEALITSVEDTAENIARCYDTLDICGDRWANAEFIVRAINSHEELLEASKYAERIINKNSGTLSANEAFRITEKLEKAIAKAEGRN